MGSRTSMQSAKRSENKTKRIPKRPAQSSIVSDVEIVRSPHTKSALARNLESPEFRLEWDSQLWHHLARNIVHLRKLRGQSQKEVADEMRTSQSAIARIEGGDDHNITLRTLRRVVEALRGRIQLEISPSEMNRPRWPDWWDAPSLNADSPLYLWRAEMVVNTNDVQQIGIAEATYPLVMTPRKTGQS